MTHVMKRCFIASSLGMGLLLKWRVPVSNFMLTNCPFNKQFMAWTQKYVPTSTVFGFQAITTIMHWSLALLKWCGLLHNHKTTIPFLRHCHSIWPVPCNMLVQLFKYVVVFIDVKKMSKNRKIKAQLFIINESFTNLIQWKLWWKSLGC